MFPAQGRRDLLRTLLAGTAGATLASALPNPRLFAQAGRPSVSSATLGPDLFLLSGAGGNVVLAIGPESAIMVNGGQREHAAALRREVTSHAGSRRVSHLFNTDWHPHHTGSNESLGAEGTEIVAHENTKQYLGTDMVVEWQHTTYKALAKRGLPTRTFYTSDSMMLGRERIEYGQLGQAHTDGDIYVFFRDANVLVAGDVLAVNAYPIADYISGGWLGGLAAATKTLFDLANDDTRVIPGRGPLQTRADLKAQHDMLQMLRDRLAKMMRQGMSVDDMRAAGATTEFDDRCGDPSVFLSTSYRGLWLHVRELGGIV